MDTGNFQGTPNPSYPSNADSLSAGASISAFYNDGARDTIMSGFSSINECENQAILCCWGRDRQSNDNNGNCNDNDCQDADPADNSNLCYTKPSFISYPDVTEGDIHCHGLAWADDENDFSSRFKNNNFFYVSMYGKYETLFEILRQGSS